MNKSTFQIGQIKRIYLKCKSGKVPVEMIKNNLK